MQNALAERLVAGIAAQDRDAIAACFAEGAQLRALTPPGLREREGSVEDRVRITYRFTGVEEGEPYVVEQTLVCTLRDDRIERADLLCSGFRPGPRGLVG